MTFYSKIIIRLVKILRRVLL